MGHSYTPKKRGISYLDHTADVWISVEASSLGDLAVRAIEGLYGIMAEEYILDGGGSGLISLKAGNLETLFVMLLSEVLYCFEAEGSVILPNSAKVMKENDSFSIEVACTKHGFAIPEGLGGHEIKAITYHGAEVIAAGSGKWNMKLLLDL